VSITTTRALELDAVAAVAAAADDGRTEGSSNARAMRLRH
jgi:hypothetical protein|tara:strand:- start:393 stop:512 length:120 start_codon:yes stop_codon:yes gene_type:complete